MRLARALIALAFLAVGSTAWGQGAILQGGAITPGHVPMYVGQGTSQPVVQDSGSAGGGGTGLGLSEFLQGTRTAGTGPLGAHTWFSDTPTTNPAGYHYLCIDANAQGGALIAYGAGGGASNLSLAFNINGSTYSFPFTTNGAIGPGTTVAGHFAVWNNLGGTLLADTLTMPPGAILSGSLGISGTAPTLTSCGTSPSIVGDDFSGTATMGTGTPTGCIITFAAAKIAAPHCNVSWRAPPLESQSYAISTAAITLTQTATSSNVVDYMCAGL